MKKYAFILCLLLATTSLFAGSEKVRIETAEAPKALGPYSQAVVAGEYVFISGQIAIDPKTGQLVGQTIEEQTKQVLKNIEAILAQRGLTFENVVKSEVFLKDLKDFSAMNQIYGEKFIHAVKPARATVQVSMLPHNALIEIACIAYDVK